MNSVVGNVVWDDDFTASRVLMATGKEIEGNDDTSELRIPNYSQTRPNPTTDNRCYNGLII